MDILKAATDWAKAEVFSSMFFIFFAILMLLGSLGFYGIGKTAMAKAYVIPMLVAGLLILTVGVGIFIANKGRTSSFVEDYNKDSAAFVEAEIARTQKSMGEYKTAVFRVIPIIIAIAALLLIFLDTPLWRAICATTIAMMVVIIVVDTNANARLTTYHKQLLEVDTADSN